MNSTLSLHIYLSYGSARPLNEINIWSKFNENISKGIGDMEPRGNGYGQSGRRSQFQINEILVHVMSCKTYCKYKLP